MAISGAALALASCLGSSRDGPSSMISRDVADVIAVCSAGLSAQLSRELGAIVSGTEATLSADQREQIRGAIFAHSDIPADERTRVYESYLSCVDKRLKEAPDAGEELELVNRAVTYDEASAFSTYDWIGGYKLYYRNKARYRIRCLIVVKGAIRSRRTGRVLQAYDSNDYHETFDPGELKIVSGRVGIRGYNEGDRVVGVHWAEDCRKA